MKNKGEKRGKSNNCYVPSFRHLKFFFFGGGAKNMMAP